MKPVLLASLFTDHMVLQVGRPVPVWGWVAPSRPVRVRFRDQVVDVRADQDGRFLAKLAALAPGGPDELHVECGPESLVLRDVLVGEVWLCSGQSNMVFPLRESGDGERDIAAADHPLIRLFTVAQADNASPQERCNGQWRACTPETAAAFTAVGYHLGLSLHQQLRVPVGLILSAVGGTTAEAWTPREALEEEASLRHLAALADHPGAIVTEPYRDAGNTGLTQGWAAPEQEDSCWATMPLPRPWKMAGLNVNGALWYRRQVSLPPQWAGQDLALSLGRIHDFDSVYVNGQQVGGVGAENPNAYQVFRNYLVPGRLVRGGTNLIAVRIFSQWGYGGFMGPADRMTLAPARSAEEPLRLSGAWRYQVELSLPPRDPILNPLPSASLWNAMIAPLIPFAIAGVAWYQGESNAGRGEQYRTLLSALIQSWRQRWGQGELPFLVVLLANCGVRWEDPAEGELADLREAQLLAKRLPKVATASAIDLGNEEIHPPDKKPVGRRLAMAALHLAYGQDRVHDGPTLESFAVEGSEVRIRFSNVGGGLMAKDGALRGFAIAGADRVFHFADAVIDGYTVVTRSPQVPHPTAVRYAWADNPLATLYSRDGFPANPFRTDTWPTLTTGRK